MAPFRKRGLSAQLTGGSNVKRFLAYRSLHRADAVPLPLSKGRLCQEPHLCNHPSKEAAGIETVSGLNNWKLKIRREEDGIVLLRAVTCDTDVSLPETLLGLPVTRVGDRCLAPDARELAGEFEEVRVLGGPETGEWNNRRIRRLSLPRTLKHIDSYAMMNLRAMEELRLYDALRSTGTCTFMNCRVFSRLHLTRTGAEQGPALANIVSTLPQELDVTLHMPNGDTTRLLFPEYVELYEENSPARIFNLNIIGAGYPYHSVFRDKKLFLADYDTLWKQYLATEHEDGCALRLAYFRLRYPTELSEAARARYLDHLRRNAAAALSLALRLEDAEGLRLLLGESVGESEALSAALDEARSLGRTEAVALLLAERQRRFGAGRRRSFEL